ncbi:MAG TPA: HEAT repeat domain-containing protein [Gemmataceae bacterium]
MFIFFRCGRCKKPLSVACGQAGNPMLCPVCKVEIIVPSSSEIAPPRTTPTVVEPIAIPTAIQGTAPSPVLVALAPSPPKPRAVGKARYKPWPLGLAACAALVVVLVAGISAANWAWSSWKQTHATAADQERCWCEVVQCPDEELPSDDTPLPSSAEDVAARDLSEADAWQGFPSVARIASQQTEEEEGGKEVTRGLTPPAAQQEKPATFPALTGKIVVKHRKSHSEEELRKQLIWAPEVGLTAQDIPPIIHGYAENLQATLLGAASLCQEPTIILQQRPDLKSLPIRRGKESRLDANATLELHGLSKELHVLLDRLAAKQGDSRPTPVVLAEFMKLQTRGKKPEWLRPEAIPTLVQIMMTDDQPIRLLLVQLLAAIDGKQASIALAQRAVFDLSQEVRETALEALVQRPPVEFRHVLVEGLRYPWAPASDHAAEALVALGDRDAAPLLVRLLREPDPATPVQKHDHYYQREIVRLKHVDNCLTCHPPALDGSDPVQGAVPGFNFLKVKVSQQATNSTGTASDSGGSGSGGGGTTSGGGSSSGGGYGGGGGSSGGSSGTKGTTSAVQVAVPGQPGKMRTVLVSKPGTKTTVDKKEIPLTVRADITYLRQDFSILQPVVKSDINRPELFRFDYMIRLRPMTERQTKEWKSHLTLSPNYGQREAVLFALRELTNQDAGSTSEAWEKLYPAAEFDSRSAELATGFVEAPDYRKDALLKELKDSKGVVYSQALAQAIPQLSGKYQAKARSALVERMKRMTASTLRTKLGDEDREIRYAAAVACGRKQDQTLVHELNELLDDSEPIIAQAAQASIKSLSGDAGN